jgi:hypothetical protein
MTRPRNILRPIHLQTSLPEDVKAHLDLHLYSELEGCIPKGAYQRFFLARIEEFFQSDVIDLGEYSGIHPKGRFLIRSNKANIEQLKLLLARE